VGAEFFIYQSLKKSKNSFLYLSTTYKNLVF
jgi:hypothetical protein